MLATGAVHGGAWRSRGHGWVRGTLGLGRGSVRGAWSAGASAPVYRRHEAEKTVLYQIVSRELETFLAEVSDHYDKPLPAYVEKELRDFVDCGILARGFVTAVCESCGHKLLVALSCKKRGICPSCGCRRMCNAAAHLADHVVPDIRSRVGVGGSSGRVRGSKIGLLGNDRVIEVVDFPATDPNRALPDHEELHYFRGEVDGHQRRSVLLMTSCKARAKRGKDLG